MTATEPMIQISHRDGRCVIALAGDLDIASADDVAASGRAAVGTSSARDVVLDLSKVAFIDSTAIGALLTIRNAADERGLSTRLEGASPRIIKLLTITGLTKVFDLDDTA